VKKPPILLIDGDIIAFKAACAAETGVSFDGGDTYAATASLPEASFLAENMLAALLEKFGTSEHLLAFSDAANWRKAVYPPYKANRQGKPKPLVLSPLRERLKERHTCWQRPGLEADDILGILATSRRILKEHAEKIIVSIDKDLKCIPGLFHNMTDGSTTEITNLEADRWHMLQTLCGDRADNYPGCPGIGQVIGGRILEAGRSYAEWWPLVVKAYQKAGQTEEDALTQARIARICRVSDFDYKKKEVILWNPTQ
jgi:DNA polymerase-1